MLTYSYYITVLFLILSLFCQKCEMINMIDIRDENHKTIKYLAILLFTLFLLYGIISNTLMTTVLFCKRQDSHYGREFILITSQLIISHFMAFLPQIVVVLPELLYAKNNSYTNETTWINHAFSTFDTFSFFSILHFSFLLTLNRFVALISPKYYHFFESAKLHSLIVFLWLSLLVFISIDFYYCTRSFFVWNLSWETNCLQSNVISKIWWRMTYLWALFIPGAMFIMYIVIFCSIRHKRHFATNNNQIQRIAKRCIIRHKTNAVKIHHFEWSMLIQAAWNCGILEIGIITFNFLSPMLIKIFGEKANIPSKIFINCYFIFICSVTPTVHFIYNKRARDIIKTLFLALNIVDNWAVKKIRPLIKLLRNKE
ncbi:unnamed protein product [Brugia timori]|uniref:G_PROTEIN_RECEP_F1_2 domain-containing protein n=1 Tax=Brugia timori TaxID=42155 RepID=A0A0R3QUT9_9BILA|nr:unnamed protein product [Brugia timori]